MARWSASLAPGVMLMWIPVLVTGVLWWCHLEPIHQYRMPAAPPPRIAVLPSVVSQTYCEGDGEFNVLQLRVKLTFRNERDAPAVLYLGSPSVVRVVLAKDEPALRAGVFETELFPSSYSTGDAIVQKHFHVLQPGQQRSTDLPLAVPIPIAAHAGVAAGIARAGSHVLRLTIQVWPDDPALAEEWVRMASKGPLVHSRLVTAAIPFIIESVPKLVRCE